MTRRELATVGCLIEWAVSPEPPLPAVADTDAVAAFARNFAGCSLAERLGLRVLLAALDPRRTGLLSRLERGATAPLASGLAALAQLSYYGDLGVMRTLGYDPDRVRARGRAIREKEGRR